MTSGNLKPCKKPDADNIANVASDDLNGILYEDDNQICNLNVKKLYTEQEFRVYVHRQTGFKMIINGQYFKQE